jgi:hypothetical protein
MLLVDEGAVGGQGDSTAPPAPLINFMRRILSDHALHNCNGTEIHSDPAHSTPLVALKRNQDGTGPEDGRLLLHTERTNSFGRWDRTITWATDSLPHKESRWGEFPSTCQDSQLEESRPPSTIRTSMRRIKSCEAMPTFPVRSWDSIFDDSFKGSIMYAEDEPTVKPLNGEQHPHVDAATSRCTLMASPMSVIHGRPPMSLPKIPKSWYRGKICSSSPDLSVLAGPSSIIDSISRSPCRRTENDEE